MTKVEFDYKEAPTINILRPYCLIHLQYGDKIQPVLFLVDSGADTTLIPRFMGKLLGLEREKEDKVEEVSGICGELQIIRKKLWIIINDYKFSAEVLWAFTCDDVSPLLGRKDVFDRFKVTFDQKNKKVIFDSKE